MKKKPSNPPAYPSRHEFPGVNVDALREGDIIKVDKNAPMMYHPGMSLRDWFAGQALVHMAHPQDGGQAEPSAKYAYEIADAMLAEREKKGEG